MSAFAFSTSHVVFTFVCFGHQIKTLLTAFAANVKPTKLCCFVAIIFLLSLVWCACEHNGTICFSAAGFHQEEQKCFTCDSREPYDRHGNPNSHLIENVITIFDPERRMRWWQSQTGG